MSTERQNTDNCHTEKFWADPCHRSLAVSVKFECRGGHTLWGWVQVHPFERYSKDGVFASECWSFERLNTKNNNTNDDNDFSNYTFGRPGSLVNNEYNEVIKIIISIKHTLQPSYNYVSKKKSTYRIVCDTLVAKLCLYIPSIKQGCQITMKKEIQLNSKRKAKEENDFTHQFWPKCAVVLESRKLGMADIRCIYGWHMAVPQLI